MDATKKNSEPNLTLEGLVHTFKPSCRSMVAEERMEATRINWRGGRRCSGGLEGGGGRSGGREEPCSGRLRSLGGNSHARVAPSRKARARRPGYLAGEMPGDRGAPGHDKRREWGNG